MHKQLKVELRKRKESDITGTLRLINQAEPNGFKIDLKWNIYEKDWDSVNQRVSEREINYKYINEQIYYYLNHYEELKKDKRILLSFDDEEEYEYTDEDLLNLYDKDAIFKVVLQKEKQTDLTGELVIVRVNLGKARDCMLSSISKERQKLEIIIREEHWYPINQQVSTNNINYDLINNIIIDELEHLSILTKHSQEIIMEEESQQSLDDIKNAQDPEQDWDNAVDNGDEWHF